jgi:hypothetical protein
MEQRRRSSSAEPEGQENTKAVKVVRERGRNFFKAEKTGNREQR